MDIEAQLVQAVAEVADSGGRICVTGDGSKRDWFPHDAASQMLTTKEHTGIVAYEPSELVVTARCGTPLVDVVRELDRQDQMLACDPPRFYGDGTIGGAVSSGMSGPARPWRGRLRDAVLGVQLINGFAQVLNFGGQVMKNVAGYDVSRLVAGAGGALGIATQVSLRVQPVPENEITLVFVCDAAEGLAMCRDWAGRYLPISATAWLDGTLRVRLSGTESAISIAHAEIGGDIEPGGENFWSALRDHRLDFFGSLGASAQVSDAKLWRVIVPPATPMEGLSDASSLIEWAGGLRWVWAADDASVTQWAQRHGGWAWPRGGAYALPKAEREIMVSIKAAFDPQGVFASPLRLNEGTYVD